MQKRNLAPSHLPEVEPGLDAAEDNNTNISHSLQITAFLTVKAKEMHCKHPFLCTPIYSAAAPEQNSETKRSGQRDSPGTAIMDKLEQQQR